MECDPADVCFLVDGSFSVPDQDWEQTKELIIDMIHLLDISDTQIRVGVIQFR